MEKEHLLWNEFEKWWNGQFSFRLSHAITPKGWDWECFKEGARIGAQKAIERMAKERQNLLTQEDV